VSNTLLVTGASGMLGQAIMRHLESRRVGMEVRAPSRPELDLQDAQGVRAWFATHRPSAVLHLAGHSRGLADNMSHQVAGLALNARMGLNLIEACAAHPPDRLVIAASNTAYGYPYVQLPLREDDLLAGDVHPGEYGYSWANRMLVAGAEALRRDAGVDARVALLTNLFGPGDRFDDAASHVVPALVARFCDAADHRAAEVTVWGEPATTRDFMYVDDAAAAMCDLLRASDAPPLMNVASGVERTMRDLADAIAVTTGFVGSVTFDAAKPVGIPRRSVDTARLGLLRSGTNQIGFTEGLRRTVSWYRAHH